VDKPDTAAVQVEINCSEKQVTARSRIRSTHTPSIRCFIPSKPYRTLALERLFPPSTSSRPLRIPSVHHSHHHNIIIDASSKPPRITPKPSVCVILGETDPSPRRLKTPSLTNNLMLDILDPRNSRELQPTERGDFFDLQSQQPTFSPRKANEKKTLCHSPQESTRTKVSQESQERQENSHTAAPSRHPQKTPRSASSLSNAHPVSRGRFCITIPPRTTQLCVDGVEDAVVGEVEAVGDFDGEPGLFCRSSQSFV
jgi:hypothetical protein